MVRKYEVFAVTDFMANKTITTVREEDYLKVVEDNNYLLKTFNGRYETFKKEMKEKDEKIEKQRKQIKHEIEVGNMYYNEKEEQIKKLKEKDEEIEKKRNDLKTLGEICNEQRIEIQELKEINKTLYNSLPETEEETWTLSYSYLAADGITIRNYKQSGLLKEEYEEMYGMDSDNWLSHSLVKDRKEVK